MKLCLENTNQVVMKSSCLMFRMIGKISPNSLPNRFKRCNWTILIARASLTKMMINQYPALMSLEKISSKTAPVVSTLP